MHQLSMSSQLEVGEDANRLEKPRPRLPVDEQFDALLQEYETDSNDDYGVIALDEEEFLAEKLHNALKDHNIDDFDLDGNYKAPAEILKSHIKQQDEEYISCAADVLQRCAEYAEGYEDVDEDDQDVVVVEEISDESEAWDCETIVTTYSNLDNHPG